MTKSKRRAMQPSKDPAGPAGQAQPGADLVRQGPTAVGTKQNPHHARHSCGTCRELDLLPRTVLVDQSRHLDADCFVSLFENALDRCGIRNETGDRDFAPCFIVRLWWPLALQCQSMRRSRSAPYEDIKKFALAAWPQIKHDEEQAEKLRDGPKAPPRFPTIPPREVHEEKCPACRILKPLEEAGKPLWQGNQRVLDFAIRWDAWLAQKMFPISLEQSGECFFYRLLTPIQLMLQKGRGIEPWSTPYSTILRTAIEAESHSRNCNWDVIDTHLNNSTNPNEASEYQTPVDCTLLDLRHGYFVDITRNGLELARQYRSTLPLNTLVRLRSVVDKWLEGVHNLALEEDLARRQQSKG